jgi:hypothetical protein
MNEATRTGYTKAEMIDLAQQWIKDNYGPAHPDLSLEAEEKAKMYERLGMLIQFISEHFDE